MVGRLNSALAEAGVRTERLEEFFDHHVEADAAPILARLGDPAVGPPLWSQRFNLAPAARRKLALDGFRAPGVPELLPMSAAEKTIVAAFVASMLVRVPTYKEVLRSPALFGSLVDAAGGELLVDGEKLKVELDRLQERVILHHLREYARSMRNMTWFVAESDCDAEFLFSDAPVITAEYGAHEDIDLSFPISPTRTLLMTRKFVSPFTDALRVMRCARKVVNFYNKLVVMNAESSVFSRGRPPVAFIRRYLGQRVLRVSTGINVAPADAPLDAIGPAPLFSGMQVRQVERGAPRS